MRKIKPKFAYDDENKKLGVVLSSKDFEYLIDQLEDYHDYKLIQKLEPFSLKGAVPLEDFMKKTFGVSK